MKHREYLAFVLYASACGYLNQAPGHWLTLSDDLKAHWLNMADDHLDEWLVSEEDAHKRREDNPIAYFC